MLFSSSFQLSSHLALVDRGICPNYTIRHTSTPLYSWRRALLNSASLAKVMLICTVAAPLPIFVANIAEARPSTTSYICTGLKNFIRSHGAIVMNHKNASVYQRFVANRSYCSLGRGYVKRYWVPTRSGTCALKVCTDDNPYKFFD